MTQAVKQNYRVKEVAELLGISASTLRLWESHGLLSPIRTAGEQRLYTDQDIERARAINRLRKIQSLNIAAIKSMFGHASAPGQPAAAPSILGMKLRETRKSLGMTLKDVQRRTGLPISLISTLERTSSGVSMAGLMMLANCYGAPITDLLAAPQEPASRIVRAGAARRVPILGPLILIDQLAEGQVAMDCQRWTLLPGAASQGSYDHQGEEFITILEGEFEIMLAGEELSRLRAGDSIYFPSTITHSWRNPADQPTILIWISTPKTF